jgi:endonuclease V-like protein UPF0215 family
LGRFALRLPKEKLFNRDIFFPLGATERQAALLVLHLEKKAIRALGVAESFRKNDEYSTLAGVVMRSDLVIDGFSLGRLKVAGSDATDSILELFSDLGRNDVNALMLSGSVLSLYNIVDVDKLHEKIKLPVVALSFKKSSSDLERNVKERFDPADAREKIALLRKLGAPEALRIATGYTVYVRAAGLSGDAARRLLNRFTLQGSVPEPVRLASLLARAVAAILAGSPKDREKK